MPAPYTLRRFVTADKEGYFHTAMRLPIIYETDELVIFSVGEARLIMARTPMEDQEQEGDRPAAVSLMLACKIPGKSIRAVDMVLRVSGAEAIAAAANVYFSDWTRDIPHEYLPDLIQ